MARKKQSHVAYDAATYIDSKPSTSSISSSPTSSRDAIIDPSPLLTIQSALVLAFHPAGTTARRHGRGDSLPPPPPPPPPPPRAHTDRPLHEESSKRPGRSPVIRLPRGNAPFIHVSLIHQHRRVPAAQSTILPPRDGAAHKYT